MHGGDARLDCKEKTIYPKPPRTHVLTLQLNYEALPVDRRFWFGGRARWDAVRHDEQRWRRISDGRQPWSVPRSTRRQSCTPADMYSYAMLVWELLTCEVSVYILYTILPGVVGKRKESNRKERK